jgi:prefoldin subunit 5
MANSFVRYTGDGNTSAYSIPFSYRSTADLVVTLAGSATTAYTLNAAGTTLTFNSPPASAAAIEIRRKTSQGTKLVDYASGSVLTESDLDTDSDQAFFMGQEAIDDANDVIKVSNTNFQFDVQNKRLINVADPVDNQDAATKNYIENTWLSSSDKATLNNVNSNIAAINTVNSNISAITTANSNETNINTVATNITSVNTVAADITKVIAVANDLAEAVSEVETVADDLNEATSEIDTVATNIANVNTVGNDIANVNTVAGISANVTTVAGISANVTTVATNNANVTSVANNATNINTVATNITNVNAVASDITNVNSVASNLSGVNSFAERYRISSSAPTTSNDVGDLYFDTTANELKVYKTSGWAAAGSTVNGTANRFEYTATAGQTTFSGADSNSAVMAYDAGFIDVYLNGVKLAGADYTATTGTSVVLASGASVNDILMVVAYGTFQLANISINDLTNTPASLGTAGQALVVNAAANALEYANASSAEVYGFHRDNNGNLIVTTTNQGADNISATDYANFDDVLYAASGFTWSINNGELIATI